MIKRLECALSHERAVPGGDVARIALAELPWLEVQAGRDRARGGLNRVAAALPDRYRTAV